MKNTSSIEQSTPYNKRWSALFLLCTAEFLVIMDTSIIGVALPAIKADLGYTQTGLQWIFNAYVILFGGFFITRRTSVRLIRCTKNIYVGVCHTNLCISSRRCCMVRIDAQFRKSSPGTWLSVHCSGSTYISFIQIYRSKGTQQSTWILGSLCCCRRFSRSFF